MAWCAVRSRSATLTTFFSAHANTIPVFLLLLLVLLPYLRFANVPIVVLPLAELNVGRRLFIITK